jgi:hypothetical protein
MKIGERMHKGPATARKMPVKMDVVPVLITFPIIATMSAPAEAHPRVIPAFIHPLKCTRENAA